MLADMHAHYPMHVEQGGPFRTVEEIRRFKRRPLLDKLRAVVLQLASRVFSDKDWWSGDRVTMELLDRGDARLVFSVLFSPADEIDAPHPYPQAPRNAYFGRLLEQLERVEEDLRRHAREGKTATPVVVRSAAELDAARDDRAIAFVHCVEGGFHLGGDDDAIAANVATLAERGVAYVTLAHLFWRKVATNANALPFVSDAVYRWLWPQPRGEGLSRAGEAAVRAMVEHGVLIDVSHMDAAALDETFALLEKIAPGMPVIASHAGYRFGKQDYMLDARTVERIAGRNGVIGLIMAQHQLNDGIRRKTKTLDESVDVICRHIDRIAEIAGSHDHIALGTDLDGFIKPTLTGVDTMADLPRLREKLLERYPEPVVEAIGYGNAERVLRVAWAWREERRGRP